MRSDLPRGTVTLPFTDVQGSTRLLDEVDAERYGELLGEHHRVCRAAWEAHGGVEVDTAGDAFFVAFARPSDALAAAEEAQRAVAKLGLHVRMGVHTGEVTVTETGYVGLEVHRAARIAAAAHGGQVVVSATTAALVDRALTDLGEHRFKDLGAAERVFQLGEGAFPPLRSLQLSNLPVPATPFLGRERELAEVVGLLAEGGPRVVTLTGPGGTGKTRLALQAAAEASDAFPDGVRWVALAALRDPAQVLAAVAAAVGLEHDDEATLAAALVSHLTSRRQLLVLDNAEHLLPPLAPIVAALITDAPAARMLVTSRERLRIAGETAYPVPELTHDDAVELFTARALQAGARLDSGAAEVAELCDRLERLPLALELAAARAALLSPEQLLDRLGQRLDLLKGGRDADPRQATLRATIDWSHDLLDEEEQRVFRGLAVFVGGCTFEAAEEVLVAELDTLQSLLDQSLIRRRSGQGGERLWMLETVREYAAERLGASEENAAVAEAHAAWAQALASRAEAELFGPAAPDVMVLLDDEIDNLRAAFVGLVERRDAHAADLALDLRGYLRLRGHRLECLQCLQAGLRLPGVQGDRRCRMLMEIAFGLAPDEDVRRRALEEAEPLAQELGDLQLQGRALEARATWLGDLSAREQVDTLERARAFYEQAGLHNDLARVTLNLGAVLLNQGRPDDALRLSEEAAALGRARGNRQREGLALLNAADALLLLNEPQASAARLRTAIERIGEAGDADGLAVALGVAAHVAFSTGDLRSAALLLGAHDDALPPELRDPDDERLRLPLRNAIAAELAGPTDSLLAEGAAFDLRTALGLAGTVLDRVADGGETEQGDANLDSRDPATRP